MLYCVCCVIYLNGKWGKSGRIVTEIDPNTKRNLYAALHRDEQILKDWLLERAEEYIRSRGQLSMFDIRQENAAGDKNSE